MEYMSKSHLDGMCLPLEHSVTVLWLETLRQTSVPLNQTVIYVLEQNSTRCKQLHFLGVILTNYSVLRTEFSVTAK